MIKKLNVVLDTNALISILSRKLNFHSILTALKNDKFNLFLTHDILLEYEEKLLQFYGEDLLSNVLFLFEILPNVHRIETFYNLALITADPSDNKFVDCAFACNAHYIITNDKHFNVLANIDYPKIRIVSIEKFASIIG